jgi:hypothetical protein
MQEGKRAGEKGQKKEKMTDTKGQAKKGNVRQKWGWGRGAGVEGSAK